MFHKITLISISCIILNGCVVPNNQMMGAGLGAGVGGMTCASWGKGFRHNPALIMGKRVSP
jgi:hypothetical protein